MKVNTIPPVPVKPVREFVLTEAEALLVKNIIGQFTDGDLAQHMHVSEESVAFVRINRQVDALFEQLTVAFSK